MPGRVVGHADDLAGQVWDVIGAIPDPNGFSGPEFGHHSEARENSEYTLVRSHPPQIQGEPESAGANPSG